MQLIAYIIIYPILWLISLLPFRMTYIISDVISFTVYRVFGYRKKTVKSNLRLVFPEKSEQEINTITKKFYTHLCDLFLEMIKTLTISKKQLEKRFVINNKHTIETLKSHKKGIVLMYGHYASYEWSSVLQSHVGIDGLAIYKRIRNKYFDGLVKRIRSKYDTELVDSKKALLRLKDLDDAEDYRMIGFLSDQSPRMKKTNVWLPFMSIKIPCFVGAEATAKKYNYPVGYLKVTKVKRGYYEAEIIVVSEYPQDEEKYAITKKFNRLLESQIHKAPEYYLWTHKRWKHKDKTPIGQQ